MVSFRKGQSAMEFLITYSWAFLIVLAVLGALASFYFLTPDPDEYCLFGQGFACTDFALDRTTGHVIVHLNNAVVDSFVLVAIEAAFVQSSPTGSVVTPPSEPVTTLGNLDWHLPASSCVVFRDGAELSLPAAVLEGERLEIECGLGQERVRVLGEAPVKLAVEISYIPEGKAYVHSASGDIFVRAVCPGGGDQCPAAPPLPAPPPMPV